VGGIFYDYLGAGAEATAGQTVDRTAGGASSRRGRDVRLHARRGDAILPAYLPIIERRRDEPWGERERRWQLLRRGRYVEFTCFTSRGTVFGLRTDGRVESILMSLPPETRWEYAQVPDAGTPSRLARRHLLEGRLGVAAGLKTLRSDDEVGDDARAVAEGRVRLEGPDGRKPNLFDTAHLFRTIRMFSGSVWSVGRFHGHAHPRS